MGCQRPFELEISVDETETVTTRPNTFTSYFVRLSLLPSNAIPLAFRMIFERIRRSRVFRAANDLSTVAWVLGAILAAVEFIASHLHGVPFHIALLYATTVGACGNDRGQSRYLRLEEVYTFGGFAIGRTTIGQLQRGV